VLATLGVTPYGAVQFQDFHTPPYSESQGDLTGGGFGLSFNARNATDVRTELGSRFDTRRAFMTSRLCSTAAAGDRAAEGDMAMAADKKVTSASVSSPVLMTSALLSWIIEPSRSVY